MGVPAAGGIAAIVPAVRLRPDVVPVLGDRRDVDVRVRVEMLPRLPFVPPALDDVPEVRDHAGFDEEVAVLVVVEAPRVRSAVGEDFEDVLRRMVSPDAGVDRLRACLGVPGLPTRLCVNTPWQPYSQPSGPQMKLFSVSCVSSIPQPSSRICGCPGLCRRP